MSGSPSSESSVDEHNFHIGHDAPIPSDMSREDATKLMQTVCNTLTKELQAVYDRGIKYENVDAAGLKRYLTMLQLQCFIKELVYKNKTWKEKFDNMSVRFMQVKKENQDLLEKITNYTQELAAAEHGAARRMDNLGNQHVEDIYNKYMFDDKATEFSHLQRTSDSPPPPPPPKPKLPTVNLTGASTPLQLGNGQLYITTLESPSMAIPKLTNTEKISSWAKRVERALKHRGHKDLKDPSLGPMYMPAIMGQLPDKIAVAVGERDLFGTIEFLKSHGVGLVDLQQIMWNRKRKIVSPSVTYQNVVDEIMEVPGMKLDMAKLLAWIVIRNNLPWGFRCLGRTRKIKDFPSKVDLEELDYLWLDYNNPDVQETSRFINAVKEEDGSDGPTSSNAGTVSSTVGVNNINDVTELQKQLHRLSSNMGQIASDFRRLQSGADKNTNNVNVTKVEPTKTGVTPTVQIPVAVGNNTSPSQNYFNGNFNPRGRGQRGNFYRPNFRGNNNRFQTPRYEQANQQFVQQFAQRGSNVVRHNNSFVAANGRPRYPLPQFDQPQYCFYHKFYGPKAYHCLKPCNFFADYPQAPTEGVIIYEGLVPHEQRAGKNNNATTSSGN